MRNLKKTLSIFLTGALAVSLWTAVPVLAEEGAAGIEEEITETTKSAEKAEAQETEDSDGQWQEVPETEDSDEQWQEVPETSDAEGQPVMDSDDDDETENPWDITFNGITINGHYFQDTDTLVMTGDEVTLRPQAYFEGELIDTSTGGYTYTCVLSDEDCNEYPVTDNGDGTFSFIAGEEGEWEACFHLKKNEEYVTHLGFCFCFSVSQKIEKPTDFTVKFEKDLAEVTKDYIDTTDSNGSRAYPYLYIGGTKVPEEWEDKPEYFTTKKTSSDESVIKIDYWGYAVPVGLGTATVTVDVFYTPDRDLYEPYYLTSAELTIVVTEDEMSLSDFSGTNRLMYITGETAVLSPLVYQDHYDYTNNKWVYTYEDMSNITMDFQVDGLTADQYSVSADKNTLTIPKVPAGEHLVTVTAFRGGNDITQAHYYVIGNDDAPEINLKANTRLGNNEMLTNTNGTSGGAVYSDDMSLYDWGDLKFTYLDPDTKERVTWFNGQSIAGGPPNNLMNALKAGKVLVRAELYRNIGDTETPLVTEELTVTARASFNKTYIDLMKGNSFTVKPSDYLTGAGITVTGYTSSDTSVFTVSSNGTVKAVKAGAASLIVTCKQGNGLSQSFCIPVNVYEIKLSQTSAKYTGKAIKPTVTVKGPKYTYQRTSQFKEVYGFVAAEGASKYAKSDVKVTYAKNTNVGTATVTVKFNNGYFASDAQKLTFKITKANNTITKVSTAKNKVTTTKTLKYSQLKKKAQSFNLYATVKGGAKKTYKLTSVPKAAKKYITVTNAGTVKIKKGLAKKTYKIKVKISAAATKNYKAKSVTKTITIKVS